MSNQFDPMKGDEPFIEEKNPDLEAFNEEYRNSQRPLRPSVIVLLECAGMQERKSNDYQNPNSNVKQAMHYRRGIDTIHDMIWQKLLRAQSLIESKDEPKNEALEDTYKDIINYCSFAVTYIRGEMQGQDDERNMFNERK